MKKFFFYSFLIICSLFRVCTIKAQNERSPILKDSVFYKYFLNQIQFKSNGGLKSKLSVNINTLSPKFILEHFYNKQEWETDFSLEYIKNDIMPFIYKIIRKYDDKIFLYKFKKKPLKKLLHQIALDSSSYKIDTFMFRQFYKGTFVVKNANLYPNYFYDSNIIVVHFSSPIYLKKNFVLFFCFFDNQINTTSLYIIKDKIFKELYTIKTEICY